MPIFFRLLHYAVEITSVPLPPDRPLDLSDRVPKDLLDLLLQQAHYLDLRHPGQFPAHHRGLGQRLAGPLFLADREVVEPFALVGVPQRPATLADRHTSPPHRPPVRAVIGGGRGTELPFLHVHTPHWGNTVEVLREPVRLVAVQVDPFDALAVAAARRHHKHRRHRRPPSPLVGESQSDSTPMTTSGTPLPRRRRESA